MDPITIGLLLGGAGGLLTGGNNEKKMYQDKMLKAELAQYAPYSSLAQNIAGQGDLNLPDQTSSLFSGAATGASAGNLFGKAAAPTDPGADMAAVQSQAPSSLATGAQNSLGGTDMANAFGAQYGGQPYGFPTNEQLQNPMMLSRYTMMNK